MGQPQQSAAEMTAELDKLRRQVADLTAKADLPPASSFSASTELDAGMMKVETEDGKLEDVQTYWYTINLPPSGGEDIKINGTPFHHGQRYRVRQTTLSSIKEAVFRAWRQEDIINGAQENPYRSQTQARFSARTGQRTQ